MRLPLAVRGGAVRFLICATVLLLLGQPAQASIIRFLSVEDLSRASTQVVRARVTGQSVHWTADHEGIYTAIEAVVLEEISGSGAPGGQAARGPVRQRRITIIQAGGVIDDVSLDWTGRPKFQDGEDLVLFLQPYEPADVTDDRLILVGGKQGRMRVIEDHAGRSPLMVERELTGVLGAPSIPGEEPKGPAPRRDLLPFEDLRGRVLSARGGGR